SSRALVDLGAGKIQQLLLDPRDGASIYAALWDGSSARVYRVAGSSVTRLDDSLLRDIVPADQTWPDGVPKPFPLSHRMKDGTAPSLFLSLAPRTGSLYVSTIFRGVFVRID
ncbi:MAG TPA: hypothetical protein VM600_05360, partial [Actinomycetota bacterium]|nr:hypothetical protein [Actinomycetota bacterium]